MKAIIIGGGIGGPVAALALQRAGMEAHVYETHGGPADSLGLFLGLGINGMRVLRELGVLEAVQRADTIPTPMLSIASSSGKLLGTVSNGWLDAQTPSITLMRGALQRALTDAARERGVRVHHHKRFNDYRETADLVVARFADGDEVGGDILIGADGIRSRVREVMAPDAPRPSYTGLLNLGGVVSESGLDPTPDTMRMVWGRRAFFGYTVRSNGEAWWFANVGRGEEPSREELAAISVDTWKRQLHDLFAGDPAFIGKMIEATGQIGTSPIHDLPSLPRWSRGRVVLLGDAAHAVSPSAGQGASMALEDALMLARCLRDLPPETALARYEALRRPRAERIVATGRRRGKYKAPESRTALFLRDLLMPVAMRLFATDRATSWIYDYEIPWKEPELTDAA